MRSSRTVIKIFYKKRVEVSLGVWEDKDQTPVTVKAEQEQIYQQRRDQAMAEGLVITARFRVRLGGLISGEVDRIEWQGGTYKARQVTDSIDSHYSYIEAGEMI